MESAEEDRVRDCTLLQPALLHFIARPPALWRCAPAASWLCAATYCGDLQIATGIQRIHR